MRIKAVISYSQSHTVRGAAGPSGSAPLFSRLYRCRRKKFNIAGV